MLKRFCLALLAAVAMLVTQSAFAIGNPENTACEGPHRVGDEIICYVTFQGDPEFSQLSISFNLQSAQDPKDRGLPINFVLRKSRKIGKGTYEIRDVLEPSSAGTFLMAAIVASAPQNSYRVYSNGYQFTSKLMVEVGPAAAAVPQQEVPAETKDPVIMAEPDRIPGQPSIPEPEDNTPSNKVKADIPERDEKVIVGGHDPVRPASPDAAVPPDGTILNAVKENFAAAPTFDGVSSSVFPNVVQIHGTPPDRACEGGHTPGAKITCYLVFDGDFSFTYLYLSFYNPNVQPDQGGLCNSFTFQEKEKVSADTYKITGVLPACATGAYVLSGVQAHSAAAIRNYNNGSDYQNQYPVIWLENPHQTLLPDVIYVGSNPPPK